MKVLKQLYRHDPENGVIGDCHRTCIAMLLDKEHPGEVPHFGEICYKEYDDSPEVFERLFAEWLNANGYVPIYVPYQCDFDTLMTTLSWQARGVYYILGVSSKNGTGHSLIGCGGQIVADPSLDESGHNGPMSDGLYWVTFLLSTQFQVNSKPVIEDPEYRGLKEEADDGD